MRCFGDFFEKTSTSMFWTMFYKTQNIEQTIHLTMLIAHPYLQLGQCLCLLLDPFLAVPKLLEALVFHLCIVSLLSLGYCCLKLLVCPFYLLLNYIGLVLQVISFFSPSFLCQINLVFPFLCFSGSPRFCQDTIQ